MRTAFLGGGHDCEDRRDDAREGNHPDGPAQGPELDRPREEDEAAEQEAQADEPTQGPFRPRIHVRASHSRHKDSEAKAAPSRKVSSASRRCARVGAGRSAEDRLLCKQEVLGSNPSRSIASFVTRDLFAKVTDCDSPNPGVAFNILEPEFISWKTPA